MILSLLAAREIFELCLNFKDCVISSCKDNYDGLSGRLFTSIPVFTMVLEFTATFSLFWLFDSKYIYLVVISFYKAKCACLKNGTHIRTFTSDRHRAHILSQTAFTKLERRITPILPSQLNIKKNNSYRIKFSLLLKFLRISWTNNNCFSWKVFWYNIFAVAHMCSRENSI